MQDLEIGGVTFRVEYRNFGGDNGPAIRVLGDVDGETKQLLRFDCFEDDPHYHYDPTGANVKHHLDELTMGCPVDFSLTQIASKTQAMVEKAGFADAAARIDQPQIESRVDEIRLAIEQAEANVTATSADADSQS